MLVRGESGTGKELAARALHKYSPLRDKPLLTLNCTALTATLMESELFGHRRGSFTGAVADKAGLFEKADGGTIFLDEIGDMPLEMQGKLAARAPGRRDQTRRRRRHAARPGPRDRCDEPRSRAGDAKGEFRDDLFYRFNTFTITLPQLRERVEDLPILAYHFLPKAEAKVKKKNDALDLLERSAWRGNLRELENTVGRAVVLAAGGAVESAPAPSHSRDLDPWDDRGRRVACEQDSPRTRVRASSRCPTARRGGNVSIAAKLVRISRRNFHRLLTKHRILCFCNYSISCLYRAGTRLVVRLIQGR